MWRRRSWFSLRVRRASRVRRRAALLPRSGPGCHPWDPCNNVSHGPRRNKAADEETSVLGGIEPMMHVPAGLESRNYPLGHPDLGAIARISSGAGLAPLDPEHAKAA